MKFSDLWKTSTTKIEVPEPSRFPKFGKTKEWMDEKIAYYQFKYPEQMDNLFNPSSGDYIPINIFSGLGHTELQKSLPYYRELKKQYPEAVKKAKENFLPYAYYREGDPEDYPDM